MQQGGGRVRDGWLRVWGFLRRAAPRSRSRSDRLADRALTSMYPDFTTGTCQASHPAFTISCIGGDALYLVADWLAAASTALQPAWFPPLDKQTLLRPYLSAGRVVSMLLSTAGVTRSPQSVRRWKSLVRSSVSVAGPPRTRCTRIASAPPRLCACSHT